MALLEISKVSLSFSGLRALIDVSFDVAEGGIVGLIGPNGAGKSTLLNCISCLYRPENGQIRFDGRDLAGRKSHQVAALGIRRTFQNLELFREASVRPKRRRATRPTFASKQRRLEGKKIRGKVKSMRGRRFED